MSDTLVHFVYRLLIIYISIRHCMALRGYLWVCSIHRLSMFVASRLGSPQSSCALPCTPFQKLLLPSAPRHHSPGKWSTKDEHCQKARKTFTVLEFETWRKRWRNTTSRWKSLEKVVLLDGHLENHRDRQGALQLWPTMSHWQCVANICKCPSCVYVWFTCANMDALIWNTEREKRGM